MDKELHPAAPEPPPPIPPAPDQGPAPIDEQAAASQSAARQHGAPAPSAKRKERVHWSNVERGEDFNLTVNFPDSATSKTVDVSMFRDQVSGLSRSRIPSWAYGAKTEGADSWHNAITSARANETVKLMSKGISPRILPKQSQPSAASFFSRAGSRASSPAPIPSPSSACSPSAASARPTSAVSSPSAATSSPAAAFSSTAAFAPTATFLPFGSPTNRIDEEPFGDYMNLGLPRFAAHLEEVICRAAFGAAAGCSSSGSAMEVGARSGQVCSSLSAHSSNTLLI